MWDIHNISMMDWGGMLRVLTVASAKGFVLLGMIGLVTVFLRKASAAKRHMVWMLGLGGLIIVPVVGLLVPQWFLPVLPKPKRADMVQLAPKPVVANPLELSVPNVAPVSADPISTNPNSKAPTPANNTTHDPVELNQSTPNTPTPIDAVSAPAAHTPLPVAFWALAAWIMGVIGLLVSQLSGLVAVRRLGDRFAEIEEPSIRAMTDGLCEILGVRHPVALRYSGAGTMPMAAGLWNAVVFLPNEAGEWTKEKLRAVLAHELAHVKRRDCLTQALARVASAVYWFNPLVWVALRQLRTERERACDDLVLSAGETPSGYAEQLLAIVLEMRPGTLASAAAVTMAQGSKIDGRVRAVLATGVNRRGVSKWYLLLGFTAVMLTTIAIGGVALTGQSKRQLRTQVREQIEDFNNITWSELQKAWIQTGKIGHKPNDPMRPILVVDTVANEIRIERPDGVRPDERIALPAGFDWELAGLANDGMTLLDSPVRLRSRTEWVQRNEFLVRRVHQSNIQLEMRGTHQETGQKIGIDIEENGGGWHTGFTTSYSIKTAGDKDYIYSNLVEPEEYQIAMDAWAANRDDGNSGGTISEADTSEESVQQAWAMFRARLGDNIRDHMESKGWDNIRIDEVLINDDLRRGHVEISASKHESILKGGGRRGMKGSNNGYDLEYLGGASWALMGRGELVGDQFVMSGLGEQDSQRWRRKLRQAIKTHRKWILRAHSWDAKYTATLMSGVHVEIIGFSESGGPDDAWWKPDGTPLDWQPYIIPKDNKPENTGGNNRWVAYALRISDTNGKSISRSFSGNNGSSSRLAQDPWGWTIVHMNTSMNSGDCERFGVDKQTTDLQLTITDKNAGTSEKLTIKNLSLVPKKITQPIFEGDLLANSRPDVRPFLAMDPEADPGAFINAGFAWLIDMSKYIEQLDAWPDGDAHDQTSQGGLGEVVWKGMWDSDYYLERAALANILEKQFLPKCIQFIDEVDVSEMKQIDSENFAGMLAKLYWVCTRELSSTRFIKLSVQATDKIMEPTLDQRERVGKKYKVLLEAYTKGNNDGGMDWIGQRRKEIERIRKTQASSIGIDPAAPKVAPELPESVDVFNTDPEQVKMVQD